jgi:hypothetical protein
VLTDTVRPPDSPVGSVGNERPGSPSTACGESSEVRLSSTADTAATVPTAPRATAEVTAFRTSLDLCRALGLPSGPRGGSVAGAAKHEARASERCILGSHAVGARIGVAGGGDVGAAGIAVGAAADA